MQTGTNPAALLRDPKLSLAQGAVALWPGASNRLFALMLESFLAAPAYRSTFPTINWAASTAA